MRFAVDTGGTFTDLVLEDDKGVLHMFKASTTPEDPVEGILSALGTAAESFSLSLGDLLSRGEMFIHGTTHAINAIVTGSTAKTASVAGEALKVTGQAFQSVGSWAMRPSVMIPAGILLVMGQRKHHRPRGMAKTLSRC